MTDHPQPSPPHPKKKARRELTNREFNAAVQLCLRAKGATTRELEKVMHFASFDCPGVLRRYLAKYRPTLKLFSARECKKTWCNEHGNALTYRIYQPGFIEPDGRHEEPFVEDDYC